MKIGNHLLSISTILLLTLKVGTSDSTTDSQENKPGIRLVGGRNEYEGRVEVHHEGQWKTVCDRSWGQNEAQVVCRQLGYQKPSNATRIASTQYVAIHIIATGRALRLVNGSTNWSGRMEVCRFGCWGTVCDEGWDRYDANVACRQLGFQTEGAIPTRGGYFGEGSGPIHLSQAECETNQSALDLTSCTKSINGLNNCLHSQDAGVICHGTNTCIDTDVQLVGGETEREGRVEMCFNGVWGAVCASGWNDIAANIVCKQLGYTSSRVPLRWENSPTLFNNIGCNETHSMLFQCIDVHNIGVYDCSVNNTAGVICEMPSPDNTISLPMITSQTTDLKLPAASNTQSAIVGVVGGLIAVGAITVISVASVVIVIMVVVKRKTERIMKGFGMDNPTYDECQGVPTLNNMTINHEFEKEFENPIYSDETIETGHNSASKTTSQLQNTSHYEGVYFESTTVNEILHKRADNGVQGAHGNGTTNNTGNGMEDSDRVQMKGAISEGVYELPPNLDDAGDENCYSTLNPTYSQLQAHLGVPKPGIEIQSPQNDDDYSCLQYP